MPRADISAQPQLPSNRKFGWFFAFVCSVGSAYAYWKGAEAMAAALLLGAALFSASALFFAALLSPLNRLWFAFGMLLGKIVSPIVLGLIFFVVITPVSLVTRLFGRDALLIKNRNVETYWIQRNPPGPAPDSFKNQF